MQLLGKHNFLPKYVVWCWLPAYQHPPTTGASMASFQLNWPILVPYWPSSVLDMTHSRNGLQLLSSVSLLIELITLCLGFCRLCCWINLGKLLKPPMPHSPVCKIEKAFSPASWIKWGNECAVRRAEPGVYYTIGKCYKQNGHLCSAYMGLWDPCFTPFGCLWSFLVDVLSENGFPRWAGTKPPWFFLGDAIQQPSR